MKLKTVAILIFVLLISTNVFAQQTESVKLPTAETILAKYVEAIGGRESNEKIKSRSEKGTIEISPMGVTGTFENYTAAPDKSYSLLNILGVGEITSGYDGKAAWSNDPMQGKREMEGQELMQTKLAANFYREINLGKLYTNWEVKGVEKVGDKEAYAIVGTPAGLEPETFYFDMQSGLLLRTDAVINSPQGKMAAKTFYEDTRDIDGVKLAFKVRVVTPQFEMITTLTEVKNNVAIDDSKFVKP